MTSTKRIPLTVPMPMYLHLRRQADLAEKSMNCFLIEVIKKRKVLIFPEVHQIYKELYLIRLALDRLSFLNSTELNQLKERCELVCRSCDTFLGTLIKSSN
jgi:hypothetical protein